jgi:hypothetical protein
VDIRLNGAYASVGLAGRSKESFQLVRVQSMFANDRAVQKQDGDIEPVTALQGRVAVDIDYIDRGKRECAAERLQLPQHLVAKLTVVTMDDCQT